MADEIKDTTVLDFIKQMGEGIQHDVSITKNPGPEGLDYIPEADPKNPNRNKRIERHNNLSISQIVQRTKEIYDKAAEDIKDKDEEKEVQKNEKQVELDEK